MSHHVIAAVRSPRIGGRPRVLNERTHANRYEADQWIGASRARWCFELEPHETHVLIAIQNSAGRIFCLLEQPSDSTLPPEKFVGKDLVAVLSEIRFDDRETTAIGDEPQTFETHDMTDRAESKRGAT